MSSIGILYKALKDAGLSPYWSTASEGQLAHGYNLVTRENLPAFCADGRICDFAKLQLTPSLLPLPDDLQLEQETDGSFRLQWTNNPCLPGAAEDDVLRLFLMRDAESFTPVAVETGNVCRGDGEARFTIPERLKDYAHLYVVFCSRTGWKSSSSRYLKLKNMFVETFITKKLESNSKCFAIFQSTPITEDVRNSLSNQTFYTLKGQNIARKKISKNGSRSQAQLVQRTRWAKALDLETLFEPASQIGFPKRKSTESYHNAFMAENVNKDAVEVSEELEVTVNYQNIRCAKGKLKVPKDFSVTADAEMHTLTFTHAAEEDGCQRYSTDRLYALVVETTEEDSELFELGTRAGSEPITVNLSESWDMGLLAIYVFALTADGKKASDSLYLEAV